MSFDTSQLDQALNQKASKNENERQKLLKKAQLWLDEFALDYGVKQAYIFGSVTRPYQFNPQSDIDIAVEQVDPEGLFLMISFLMTAMERDVDVIELKKCHFANRIRQDGVLWTNKRDAS